MLVDVVLTNFIMYVLFNIIKRDAVEQMKMEVLHKEFMLLTPFRHSKNQHSFAVQTSPTSSNGKWVFHDLYCIVALWFNVQYYNLIYMSHGSTFRA